VTDPITTKEIYQILNGLRRSIDLYNIHAALDSLIGRLEGNLKLLDRRNPDWNALKKPILSVDFDGVISEYKAGWEGPNIISDKPVDGAFRFLRQAVKHFKVLIFSTRCNEPAGICAMMTWFVRNGLELDVLDQLTFEPGKPSFYIHIDDRAIQFKGKFQDAELLREAFKPWYYYNSEWPRKQS